jgi:CMP/dCMP kinase
MSHRVIAIDGPAASGKSTVARELARRLGFVYVNSGAMYRAVTWHVLENAIAPGDAAGVAKIIESMPLTCSLEKNESRIRVGGVDPTASLWSEPVNDGVSLVSRVPQVREILVERLRRFAEDTDLVMEGRDIGSVVFPDTPYKFYIDAAPEVRGLRRAAQGQRDQIATRDQTDSSRRDSPLVVAKDAELIDSSELTIEDVVQKIIERLKHKGMTLTGKTE